MGQDLPRALTELCLHVRLRLINDGAHVVCEDCPRSWITAEEKDGASGLRVALRDQLTTIPCATEIDDAFDIDIAEDPDPEEAA